MAEHFLKFALVQVVFFFKSQSESQLTSVLEKKVWSLQIVLSFVLFIKVVVSAVVTDSF